MNLKKLIKQIAKRTRKYGKSYSIELYLPPGKYTESLEIKNGVNIKQIKESND